MIRFRFLLTTCFSITLSSLIAQGTMSATKNQSPNQTTQDLDLFITTMQSFLPQDLFTEQTSKLIKQELITYCTKNIKPFNESMKILRSINDFQMQYGNYLKKRLPELTKNIQEALLKISQQKIVLTKRSLSKTTQEFCSFIKLNEHKRYFLCFLKEHIGNYLSINQYEKCEAALSSIEQTLDYVIEEVFTQEDKKVLMALAKLHWFACFEKINYRLFFSNIKEKMVKEFALSKIIVPAAVKEYIMNSETPLTGYFETLFIKK